MKTNKLLLMIGLHFLSMFLLMYSMIFIWDHFYLNLNKIYMAAIMTSPMIIIEILLMGSMYENKKMLSYLMGASIAALVIVFLLIRNQNFINNERFLRSMIPHHSSAILMCERANITDPEIEELCVKIVETQREELEIMEEMLNETN